jgi:hypothetical protein
VRTSSRRTLEVAAAVLLSVALTAPAAAQAPSTRVRIGPTVAYLVYGSYFSGPGGLQFSNDNEIAYGGEVAVTLTNNVEAVGNVLHATSDWSFQGIPLIGTLNIGGASLWFYDAGVRVRFPVGTSGVSPLVQLSAGAIRYSVDNALLTDRATNFTYSGGLGVEAQLNRRLSILALAKDYLASFRSVDQGAVLGIEGRRSNTLAFEIGAGLGF